MTKLPIPYLFHPSLISSAILAPRPLPNRETLARKGGSSIWWSGGSAILSRKRAHAQGPRVSGQACDRARQLAVRGTWAGSD